MENEKIISKDKLTHFWWIIGIIAMEQEEVPWVVGGVGGSSQWITKR